MNKSYKKRAFFLFLFLGAAHFGSESPVFGQFYGGSSLTVAQQNNQQGYEADQRGDKVEAIRLYKLACEGGDSFGCSNLGIQFHNGSGVAQNSKEAIRLYELALKIDPNNAGAEQNLYLLGGLSQRQIDAANAAAKDAAERAAATTLANADAGYAAHLRGDFTVAAQYYQKACDDGRYAISCANLGILYHNGQGVTQNLNQAIALYEKALEIDPTNANAKRDLLAARPQAPHTLLEGQSRKRPKLLSMENLLSYDQRVTCATSGSVSREQAIIIINKENSNHNDMLKLYPYLLDSEIIAINNAVNNVKDACVYLLKLRNK